ncbi:MAG: type II toxin-antitoxin system RelE/ParE family toxin [Desulfonatronovibrio sp.]
MIIEWSLFAVEDRTRIFDYIEQDNPMAAIAVDERIMEQTARLASFPESGRSGRVEGTRELVVGHTPFIVV